MLQVRRNVLCIDRTNICSDWVFLAFFCHNFDGYSGPVSKLEVPTIQFILFQRKKEPWQQYFLELVSKELNHLAAIRHFACLCRGFEFYFQKENGSTFTLFIIFIVKSRQKEQNSTNLLLWPPICQNKSAITPKWFNSLDTNSTTMAG